MGEGLRARDNGLPEIGRRSSRARRWPLVLGLSMLVWASSMPLAALAEDDHPRVLFLQSFGAQFSPYMEFAGSFRASLNSASPTPIEFFDESLAMSRFWEHEAEGPFVDYLLALFADHQIDLVVSSGGPAAEFCVRHRDRLFPDTPLLLAGYDRSLLSSLPNATTTAGAVALDLSAIVESALDLLSSTERIVVVTGATARAQKIVEEMQRDFQSLEERVDFEWWHDLTLPEMLSRSAVLPPRTAIFYTFLTYDVDGIPRENDVVLTELHAVATAPIFGVFDEQVGKGVVGGRLISIGSAAEHAAAAAMRILGGESPRAIDDELVRPDTFVYDGRELERWRIDERQLPPGSEIRFRRESPWVEYRWPILAGFGILGLQSALIAGLVVQRNRRLRAEREALDLSSRLLTAHEDERRWIAHELHDDYSQRLARLSIDAARLSRGPEAESAVDLAVGIQEELSRLSEDVHALSYRLHPSALEDLGLREALEAECGQFNQRESIPLVVSMVDLPGRLSSQARSCLFRIAQEALSNVTKHARADRAELSLTASNGKVELLIEDNGVGFDRSSRATFPTLGLAGMRERARLAGGTLHIDSNPGQGTKVTVRVPFEEPSS